MITFLKKDAEPETVEKRVVTLPTKVFEADEQDSPFFKTLTLTSNLVLTSCISHPHLIIFLPLSPPTPRQDPQA